MWEEPASVARSADVAKLQDQLTGALIGLAHAADTNPPTESTHRVVIEGLFTTLTNVNFNEETVLTKIEAVHREKAALTPGCCGCASPCGRTEDYDMEKLWGDNEDIRSLKSLILFGMKGMAAYAYHAMVLGYSDEEVNRFFYEGLFAVGEDLRHGTAAAYRDGSWAKYNLKCMALLDKANTETYGNPAPTTVPLTVEKGPFIVITGHDLRDLKLLLEQTEGQGHQHLHPRRDASRPRVSPS